ILILLPLTDMCACLVSYREILGDMIAWKGFHRRTIDQAAGGKLNDENEEESWALLEDLALYDNESWNDSRNFAKPVKAISMPHDDLSASDHRLIEFENQVQHMMEAHLSQSKPFHVNKIASSCGICSGPHDTQYCMEEPERAFFEYASTRTDEAGNKWYTFKPEKKTLISFLIVAGLSRRLLSQMSGEHIRNEYGSSRCTRKEARLLAILTSRVTVWGIDYVAESPVKELSYVPVLDVSLIPGMGTERRSHKRMNGTPGPDRTRDSDNPGNRQKEMGRILESA
ncbi:hypothetical protein Tco_0887493, partial [Tanacetum coccineum]